MTDNLPSGKNELPEPFHTLWLWLNSLPIATGVIIVLTLLSALGTFIPQAHLQSPVGFDAMLIDRFGEQKTMLIKQLGLHHIYFTPYFFALMMWLGVSSVVCTAVRLKNTYKQFREPRVAHKPGFYTGNKHAIVIDKVAADAGTKLQKDLAALRFRVRTAEQDGVTHIYADRGFLQRWAALAIHVSVIILLLGAVYGKIYGTEGMIRLPDNSTKILSLDFMHGKHRFVAPLVKGLPKQEYELIQQNFRIDYDERIDMPEMFKHADQATQEFNKYFVKDFVSTLTVKRNGREASGEVIVNHPIRLGKLNIYQSGYQQLGYMVISQGGADSEYPLPVNSGFILTDRGPMTLDQAMNSGVMPDEVYFAEGVKAGDLYVGGKKDGTIGPMTVLHVMRMDSDGSEPGHLLTPQTSYDTSLNGEPVSIRMSEKMDNYSDFSYKLDPGIPVLYFGWILLTVAITLAMYISLIKVHIRLENGRAFMLMTGQAGLDAVKGYYTRWRNLATGK